jgi:hypothetical protein
MLWLVGSSRFFRPFHGGHYELWKEQARARRRKRSPRLRSKNPSLITDSSNKPAPDNPDYFFACTEATRPVFPDLTIVAGNVYILP